MRTKTFLWSLLGIVLALAGCVKDDIQTNTGDENGITRTPTVLSVEQAKAYVTAQSNGIFAADVGTQSSLTPLYPNWNSAQTFETEGIKGYYVSLEGRMDAILEALGGATCSGNCGCAACDSEDCDPNVCECTDCHCGHDHGDGIENESVAISTLFIKQNVSTGIMTAYVQTNIRNSENIYYVLYSTLQGEILSGNQTMDGQTRPLDLGRGVAIRSVTRSGEGGYGEWCDICNIWITPGSPIAHPKCHTCQYPIAQCVCGSGGGTEPPSCPICGSIGDPRCNTPESSCTGWTCSICGKLGNVDWYFNVALHHREHCRTMGPCICSSCQYCGMHPDFCMCCSVCHRYPCECNSGSGEDTLLFVYTPPIDLGQLHITVPKADIQMALNGLHTH